MGHLVDQDTMTSTAFTVTIVAVGIYTLQSQKKEHLQPFAPGMIFTSAVLALPIYASPAEQLVLERIGRVGGSIFGGYAGLRLIQNPVLFFDYDHPLDTYSMSMIRYSGAEALFNIIVVSPTGLATKVLFTIPRIAACKIIQSLACNSNSLVLLFKRCIVKREASAKIIVPLLAQAVVNTYCGQSSTQLFKEYSRNITTTINIFSSKLIEEKFISNILEGVVEKVVIESNNSLNKTSSYFLDSIMGSLHLYFRLLDSPEISEAYQDLFNDATDTPEDHERKRIHLEEILQNRITNHFPHSYVLNQLISSAESKIVGMMAPLINTIYRIRRISLWTFISQKQKTEFSKRDP